MKVKELMAILRQMPPNEEVTVAPQIIIKHQVVHLEEPRRKIDRGKILALKMAGWSDKEIASEMRCDYGTIRNILSQIRKEKRGDNK